MSSQRGHDEAAGATVYCLPGECPIVRQDLMNDSCFVHVRCLMRLTCICLCHEECLLEFSEKEIIAWKVLVVLPLLAVLANSNGPYDHPLAAPRSINLPPPISQVEEPP